jgi:hypothetical protein
MGSREWRRSMNAEQHSVDDKILLVGGFFAILHKVQQFMAPHTLLGAKSRAGRTELAGSVDFPGPDMKNE